MALLYNLHEKTSSADCFKIMRIRKIWEGKFFSFWFFSFEEKFTCWKWPDWLFSGWCSLLSKFWWVFHEWKKRDLWYLINQNFISKKWQDFCWGRNFYLPIFFLSHFVHKLLHRDERFCQSIFLSANFLTQVVTLSLDKNIFWICWEVLALYAQNPYTSCPNFYIWYNLIKCT